MMDCSLSVSLTGARLVLSLSIAQRGVSHSMPALPKTRQNVFDRLLETNQLSQSKVELQEALKLEPKNSRCHSLIAMVYLRQNQLKMAKIHFDNALKIDPNEKIALEWKPKVDQALGITNSSSQVSSASKTEEKQPDKSGKSGLFGGKKK